MKRQTLLSIFVIASCVTVLEATAIHGVQTATYQQAVDICSARRLSLASIEQLRHQLQLVPNNVQFWLPYRKSTSGDWRWIDGAFYANHIIDPAGSVAHQDCAVVQSSDRILDESYCFKPTKDFLCDLPGSCPHGQTCITIDNKIRSVHYGKFSWFKARDVCRNHGIDLATFHGKDMQLTIQSIHSALKAQGHFWIGLARKQWLSASGEHPTYYNWTSNADDSLGCATISHDFAWRTASCENQNAFICNVTKTEGSTVTEQTSIPVTAAEKRTGLETTNSDTAAVSEIPPSSTLATGSASAGSVVRIVLPLIIVALIIAIFFVIRYCQVIRKQKEPPKNNRETVKKMLFYDKFCKRRSALTMPNKEKHGGTNEIEVTPTNENLQVSASFSDEIEPSSRTPLMSECTEQRAVAVGEARTVTNENGSNKDGKLPVRKPPDQGDTGGSRESFNVKYGNQPETKPNLHIVKNGSKQPHEISDVASTTSINSSKQFTVGGQDDSSKAQKDPHLHTRENLHTRDNLSEQSKGSNILETVKNTNMTDNSTTPAPKYIKTHIKDLNLSQKDLANNEKTGVTVSNIHQNSKSNFGQNSPLTASFDMRQSTISVPATSREEHPITTGSPASATNSEKISPEFPALNEGRSIDLRGKSASTNQEEVLTSPDQAYTDPNQITFNKRNRNQAERKPNLHTITNGSNKLHKMSDVVSKVSTTPNEQLTKDSQHDPSGRDEDTQKKDLNVNDKENANVKENKSTHTVDDRVDDLIPIMQELNLLNKDMADGNGMLTPNTEQTSKSKPGQSSFSSGSSDSKRSEPSVLETQEENNITPSSSVSASNSQIISRYPSCVSEGQKIDLKEKNHTRKDREEVATFHTTNVINEKENEHKMLQNFPSEGGKTYELPSTVLFQTGKPLHSKTTANTKREENNLLPSRRTHEQIKRQDEHEQKQDNSDIDAQAPVAFLHEVKDGHAKASEQEFADLLNTHSSNKEYILVEYAKNPDVFHQNIDTITAHLSNPLDRPRLLLLLQQIAEKSPQVFLERHVRQVGSYIDEDSGEYPVLTVLKYFPTKFPDLFETLDDAVIKLFEKDGTKLFMQFPKLIGVLGSHSKESARKYTELLVKQIAVMTVPFKNNLLRCLADIATHFKDVVLVHKDKFVKLKHPLNDANKKKLLKALGVESESHTTLQEEDKNFKPKATKKDPAPLPPVVINTPLDRPQFSPGQGPDSAGGMDKQSFVTNT